LLRLALGWGQDNNAAGLGDGMDADGFAGPKIVKPLTPEAVDWEEVSVLEVPVALFSVSEVTGVKSVDSEERLVIGAEEGDIVVAGAESANDGDTIVAEADAGSDKDDAVISRAEAEDIIVEVVSISL
jgi:hypothetical protein